MSGRRMAFGLVVVGVVALGCKKEPPPPAQPPRPAEPARVEPKKEPPRAEPMKSAAPPVAAAPKWVQALPQKPVAAKVGDEVWATVPSAGSEMAKGWGVYKVQAVTGNTATLAGKFGTEANVPAAVIHPKPDASGIKAGDIVLASIFGRPAVGVATKVEAGKVTMKYGWIGRPKEEPVEHVMPIVPGVAVHSVVHYKGEGMVTSRYKGTVVAIEGDKVWILSGSGHVEVRSKAEVAPLHLKKDYKKGETVYAYYPAYTEGTIEKVLEPGFRYTVNVKVTGGPKSRDYFFYDLTDKL